MVGVPSLSRGCKTCRRKKVKCDRRRPVCGQCSKGARVCEGYDRKTTFLNSFANDFGKNHEPAFQNRFLADYEPHLARYLDCEPRSLRDGPGFGPSNSQLTFVDPAKGQFAYATYQTAFSPQPVLQTHPIPSSLDHVQILNNFIVHCLPSSWSASQEVPLEWLHTVISTASDDRALTMAMCALGMGWAGHVNNNKIAVGKGLEYYIAAVGALRRDVFNSSALQVLSAISLLTLYELYEFGSELSRGWITHLDGAKKIFKLLGPNVASQAPYLQLFSFYRTIEVTSAFRMHKRTWFADFGWMLLPWSRKEKNSFQQFIDLVAEATGLLEFADALESPRINELGHDSLREAAERVMSRLLDLIERMKRWRLSSHDSMLYGPPIFAIDARLITERFLERIRLRGYPQKASGSMDSMFECLQTTRLMHIYWTVLLEIYMAILQNPILRLELNTYSEASEAGIGIDDNIYHWRSEAMIKEECKRLAADISLYGEFCCQSAWQSFGPMMCTWSLRTASRWYEELEMGGEDSLDPSRGLHKAHCLSLLEVMCSQTGATNASVCDGEEHVRAGLAN